MIDGLILDRQIPNGLTDLFQLEAARHLWLTDRLRALFERWGYQPVMPPTLAYAESMSTELGSQMAQDLYRFIDREGRALALRADLTVPVARIVGTRLYDQPLPLRLSYAERVFRHITPQAGLRREFTQAGVELVGADTPQADAEVVALSAEALRAVGVERFRLALGQMGFLRSLLDGLSLSVEQVNRLTGAVDRRNDAYLCAVLDDLPLTAALRKLLRALPTLSGGVAGGRWEAIDSARRLAPSGPAHHALDRLEEALDLLHAYGLEEALLVDLGEVRSMAYYTGLVFQGYAAGVGLALCGGGRYDDLVGHFGPSLPAVGFALDVGLVRQAVEPDVDLRPAVIVEGCGHQACYAAAGTLRDRGLRVVIDALGRQGDELAAYAHARGARAVCCQGSGVWLLIDPDGETRTGPAWQMVEEMQP